MREGSPQGSRARESAMREEIQWMVAARAHCLELIPWNPPPLIGELNLKSRPGRSFECATRENPDPFGISPYPKPRSGGPFVF